MNKKNIIATVLTIALLSVGVFFWNKMQKRAERNPTDASKEEIVALIKKLPEYLGDKVEITDDFYIKTDNGAFQGTLNEMYRLPANYDPLVVEAEKLIIPMPVLAYKLASGYFKQAKK